MKTAASVCMAALLALSLAARGAGASEGILEIQPAAPTSEQDVQVLLHIEDAYAWCGSVIAASPVRPDSAEIYVWWVPAVVGASCPAVVWPVTVAVPLGRLDAGVHTVIFRDATQPGVNASLVESLTFTVTEGASSRLSLHQGRFEAQVRWRTPDGKTGTATVVPGSTAESGMFWFFGRDNWELLLKVLDACDYNGRYWVFAAGGTDVELTIEVVDVVTGETWSYTNPAGHPAGTITDTAAFSAACQP